MNRSAALAAAALVAACASAAAGDAPRDGPPALGVSFGPSGQELRFHRTVQSTARNEALRASLGLPEGQLPGVEIRTFVEYLVAAGGTDGAGRRLVDVRVGETAVSMHGIEGWNFAFDTRQPETLERPELAPGDREQLKGRLAKARAPRRYALSARGEAAPGDSAAPPGETGPEALPFAPGPGLCPGMLPCAPLAGTAAEGTLLQFEGGFSSGLAGIITHPDPIAVAGSWRVAAWDPKSRTATLVLEAGARPEHQRLRTTYVASCVVRGEATWDAARQLVTRSTVTSHIVLRLLDAPEQIDWTMTFEERLVP